MPDNLPNPLATNQADTGGVANAGQIGGLQTGPGSQWKVTPNPGFVGRDAELAAVQRLLQAGALPVVSGIGGLGKTQFAAEYAHRARPLYPGGIFWLHMERPAEVPAQIAACAGPSGLDLPGAAALSFDDRLAATRAAWKATVPRLRIFDNLEEPALLANQRPAGGGSRVLITSRRPN